MQVIDIHPHIIADDTARYPTAPLGGKQSKWSQEHAMTYETMLREMNESGVQKSVLVQAATVYGYDNSYVAAAIAAHPDRLAGVFTIDAKAPDAAQKLEYWVSKGFCGVRLFISGTSMPGSTTWFNEPITYPFWQKAAEMKLPVCLQMGAPATAELKQTLARFPNVKVVLDHISRPPIDDGPPYNKARPFFELSEFPNLVLKLTPVNVLAMQESPASTTTFMAKLVSAFGADRIAWGSNYPSSTNTLQKALEMNWNAASDLSESDKEFIFRKTALSIYPNLN